CPICAGHHKFEDCDRKMQPKCANCQGNHSSAYKGCVKYKVATIITKVANSQRMTYADAARSHRAAAVAQVSSDTPDITLVERSAPKIDMIMHQAVDDLPIRPEVVVDAGLAEAVSINVSQTVELVPGTPT